MTRKSRIVTSLLTACGLTLAVAVSAQQAERRVEVFTHAVEGAPGDAHAMPAPDMMMHMQGPRPMGMDPGDAERMAEMHAALNGPAGALSSPDMLIRHAKQLELTEDQVAALKGLQVTMRKMNVKASSGIQLAEIDVEAIADQTQPDIEALEAAFQALAKAQTAERMLPFRISREARDELTEGQRAKWDKLLAQRKDAAAMHQAHASMMPGNMRGGPNAGYGSMDPHERRRDDMDHDDDGDHDDDDDDDDRHGEDHH